MSDLKSIYNKLNKLNRKRLIFRLGMESGFFSEYNNMIIAMLYCLVHRIEFVLYSQPANFGYEKGWSDYFLPFCKEVHSKWHKKYNHRYPGAYFPPIERLQIKLFKQLGNFDYFTHELWNEIRNQDVMQNAYYNIPELQIAGDLNEACRVLVDMTWHINEEIQLLLDKRITTLELPDKYVSIHVRRGDKSGEIDLFELDKYMKLLKEKSEIKDVFVATDDYSIVEELRNNYKDYRFYTLSTSDNKGFFYDQYASLESNAKKEHMLALLVDVALLERGDIFVGTYSSNIGMFIGMKKEKDKCFGIDYDHWVMW